jgi:hypothetical protein
MQQPGAIHPPGLPAQQFRPIGGAIGNDPLVIDQTTGGLQGRGLVQLIYKKDYKGHPGFAVVLTQAGRLRLCDDLDWGADVRAAILADTDFHSHYGMADAYNGPPGDNGARYPALEMSTSSNLIAKLRGQHAIDQINARRERFQPMPDEENVRGRDTPRQMFLWQPVTSSSTAILDEDGRIVEYGGPSGNGHEPAVGSVPLSMNMEVGRAQLWNMGSHTINRWASNFPKSQHDFMTFVDGTLKLYPDNDLVFVQFHAMIDLRRLPPPYDQRDVLYKFYEYWHLYDRPVGLADEVILQNGTGVVAVLTPGPDFKSELAPPRPVARSSRRGAQPQRPWSMAELITGNQEVIPPAVDPPPHNVLRGAGDEGAHMNFGLAVAGRHLLQVNGSFESHMFWYNLVKLMTRLGFGNGYHESQPRHPNMADENNKPKNSLKTADLFIQISEKDDRGLHPDESRIDFERLRLAFNYSTFHYCSYNTLVRDRLLVDTMLTNLNVQCERPYEQACTYYETTHTPPVVHHHNQYCSMSGWGSQVLAKLLQPN